MPALEEIVLASSSSVYEPAEDSEMLAEIVARDAGVRGDVLEIGTGSGVVAIIAALKPGVKKVTATDVNKAALKLAAANAKANGVEAKISFIESDLFERVPRGARFDCVVFNPPYLPASKEERIKGVIGKAFDGGGARGRRVTERFLRGVRGVRGFVKPGGVVLLVQSSLSDYEKTLEDLACKGFKTEIAASRRFFFEEIAVVKAVRVPRRVLKTRAR